MESRPLGATGLTAGVIGMGTWKTFDIPLSEGPALQTRIRVTDVALETGANFLDSSPMYGNAEAVLARTLEGRRSQAVVATKVWSSSVSGGRKQISQALQYYDGRVDVYQIHNLVGWREYLPILSDLRSEGRVAAVGITHYAQSALPEMMRIMQTEQIDTIQILYNAADPAAATSILPLAESLNTGVIVMSPLGTGALLRNSPAAAEIQPFEAYGCRTWSQALLKWVISDPRVHVAIPATSSPDHMRENAEAGNPPLFGPDQRERVRWLASRSAS